MSRLLVEPLGSHLRRRSAATGLVQLSGAPPRPLRQAAIAAAATLAVTSSGETVLLAVLLGLAAADVATAAVAAGATLALALRWGSTSLDAIAGAQAVLGPGAMVGSVPAAAAAWCAAAALVVAAPRGWPAVAFGAAAALGVAGPAIGGPDDVAIRVVGTLAGVGCALVAGRGLPRRPALAAAIVLVGTAVVLAGLA